MRTISLIIMSAGAILAGCTTSDPSTADSGGTTTPAPAVPVSPDTAAGGADQPDQADRAGGAAACSATPLTGDAAGDLRIGMTVEAVRSRCGIARDGTRPGPEGETSRVIAVAMGADTVEAEIVDGRVWRIPVTSPRLRTADGLGVGTPLSRLLALRDVRPAMGEGLYVLSPGHCGISFRLDNPSGPLPPAQTVAELRRLPASTVVSRLLLTGCEGARR